ncbi:hypothetical protein RN001_005751 [Aquatica leii]|uniref:Uncharacterized protein n=1 Tax=Aquatica leii TaxID=1421715 RepID=A0AAN7PC96_9COLE|nr:hypothetical protein RN001_005751 [Aquatica leii]
MGKTRRTKLRQSVRGRVRDDNDRFKKVKRAERNYIAFQIDNNAFNKYPVIVKGCSQICTPTTAIFDVEDVTLPLTESSNPNANKTGIDSYTFSEAESAYCGETQFIDKLRECAITDNIELIQLPTDARTLLKTQKNHVNIRQLDNGHYVHLGSKNYLDMLFSNAEDHVMK